MTARRTAERVIPASAMAVLSAAMFALVGAAPPAWLLEASGPAPAAPAPVRGPSLASRPLPVRADPRAVR